MKIDTDSEEPRRSIAGSILTVVELNDPDFRGHMHVKYKCQLPIRMQHCRIPATDGVEF